MEASFELAEIPFSMSTVICIYIHGNLPEFPEGYHLKLDNKEMDKHVSSMEPTRHIHGIRQYSSQLPWEGPIALLRMVLCWVPTHF